MALPVRRGDGDSEATPARPGPLAELERLNRQLASVLDLWSQPRGVLAGGFTPLADVEEGADAYQVEIELPGIKRGDLDIEIAGRRLTVRGERKEKERVGILRRRERVVGRFHYEVMLPGSVEEDGVEANLDEGVLTIRLPKPPSERSRRIQLR